MNNLMDGQQIKKWNLAVIAVGVFLICCISKSDLAFADQKPQIPQNPLKGGQSQKNENSYVLLIGGAETYQIDSPRKLAPGGKFLPGSREVLGTKEIQGKSSADPLLSLAERAEVVRASKRDFAMKPEAYSIIQPTELGTTVGETVGAGVGGPGAVGGVGGGVGGPGGVGTPGPGTPGPGTPGPGTPGPGTPGPGTPGPGTPGPGTPGPGIEGPGIAGPGEGPGIGVPGPGGPGIGVPGPGEGPGIGEVGQPGGGGISLTPGGGGVTVRPTSPDNPVKVHKEPGRGDPPWPAGGWIYVDYPDGTRTAQGLDKDGNPEGPPVWITPKGKVPNADGQATHSPVKVKFRTPPPTIIIEYPDGSIVEQPLDKYGKPKGKPIVKKMPVTPGLFWPPYLQPEPGQPRGSIFVRYPDGSTVEQPLDGDGNPMGKPTYTTGGHSDGGQAKKVPVKVKFDPERRVIIVEYPDGTVTEQPVDGFGRLIGKPVIKTPQPKKLISQPEPLRKQQMGLVGESPTFLIETPKPSASEIQKSEFVSEKKESSQQEDY